MQNGYRDVNIEVIDIGAFFSTVKKRFYIVLLVTMAAVACAVWLNYWYLPPQYQSESVILVTRVNNNANESSESDSLDAIIKAIPRIPVLSMTSYVEQAKSDVLINRVVEKLKLDREVYTVKSLAKTIEVSSVNDTNLLKISVINRDPRLAADIADTLTNEFMLLMQEKNLELINNNISYMIKQISSIDEKMASSADNAEREFLNKMKLILIEKINEDRIAGTIDMGSSQFVVFSPAQISDKPVKPNKNLNIMVSFILGLIASIFSAVIFDRLLAGRSRSGQPREEALKEAHCLNFDHAS